MKLQQFIEDREKYLEEKKGTKRCTTTPMMQDYRHFVKQTLPLETEGSGSERMRRVAAKWKQRQDQLTLENQAVM